MKTNFIVELREILPESSWSSVFRSLRQDGVIWEKLQNEDFSNIAFKHLGSDPNLWTPINLSLLDSGYAQLATKAIAGSDIPENLRILANETFEDFSKDNDTISRVSLEKAGILAISLYDHRNSNGNWDFLNNEIKFAPLSVWKPIFACLFGLLESPDLILNYLFSQELNNFNIELGIHALLSTQYLQDELVQELFEQLIPLSIDFKILILQKINQQYPTLSKPVALKIIDQLKENGEIDLAENQHAKDLLGIAEIYQISGQFSKAIPLLDAAWEQTRNHQINLSADLANTAVLNNDPSTAQQAMQRATNLNPNFEHAQAEFAIAQFQSGKIDPKHFNAGHKKDESSPFNSLASLVVQAKLALKSGDKSEAINLANKSLEFSKQNPSEDEGRLKKDLSVSNYLRALADLFFELKMYKEASITANKVIAKNPNDLRMLTLLSQAELAVGDLDRAIETSHLTVSLDPKSMNNRRVLGKSLAAREDWVEALTEYQTLIDQSSEFDSEDHYLLALSALKVDNLQKSIETSQLILDKDNSNGSAHAILGEALIKLGDVQPALEHLDQAISFSPEIPEPWLTLSKYHLDNGDLKKATEKLISANQAIPENIKLRFKLGKCYLEQNHSTQALTEIQHAASLLSADTPLLSQDVNISLGSTLIELGYLDEAKKRLSLAHETYPDNLKLSHIYAKSLLGLEEIPEAIEILSEAIQSPKAGLHIYTDYGEAHLKLGENSKEAIRAFEKVLENDPDNPKSLALMAEAIALDGNLKKSLETYKKALAKGLSKDPEWNLRIKIGMAKAALASKKPEIAVAALEDLVESNPEDLRILQILAEAYLASNLQENALKTLKNIQHLSEKLPTTLLWVADKALAMDQADIATQALITAADYAPERSNILVRLGYMQLQNEETGLAKEAFERLLQSPKPDTKDLKLAAKALIGLDDLLESVPYLEKSIEIGDENQLETLADLTGIFLQVNDFEKALGLIEQQILLSPSEARLFKTKADILLELERPMAALSSIHDAIKINPTDADLHMKASKLFRSNQDLPAALHHSEKALEIDPENHIIQIHAAEICSATLDIAQLDQILFESKDGSQSDSWVLLKVERMIQLGDYSKAIEMSENIAESSHEDPRYLAIQAQLLKHDGNAIEAKSTLRKAVKNIETIEIKNLKVEELNACRFAIIQSAFDLWEWKIALEMSSAAIEDLPNEPRPHWMYMKALVLRAEYQHLCEAANVIKHAPGIIALNKEIITDFNESVVSGLRTSCTDNGKKEFMRWQTRGQLAFGHPDSDLSTLFDNSDDIAAQVAAYNRQGNNEQAIEIAQSQKDDPIVLLQLAITLANVGLMEAQGAAYKAVEKQPGNPINHAILAYLADESAEYSLALESIRRALNIWGDEAEWHILAGQLQSRLGYRAATIAHYEKANQLRPSYAPYILELGKAHLSDQRSENAIKLLEKAVQLNPENSEIWACLATAYQESENYDQASFCVDKLTELIPDQVEPYLVGARINLSAENLEKAETMISKALSMQPDLTEALQLQAQALSLGNKPEKAVNILDKAIAKTSNPLPLLIERAKLIPLLHGEEKGLSTLKSIAKEYPDEPTILMALTDALIQAGKYEDAILSAQYALKVNFGKLEQKDIAQLQYQLGILLRQSGQHDLAIHYLNETIQLSPGFLNAYLEIAEVYRQRRQHQEALDYLKQAISIAPNDARPFSVAGNLLKEAKDYQGAKDMLDRAASLAPKDVDIQRKLGAVTALTLVHPTQDIED